METVYGEREYRDSLGGERIWRPFKGEREYGERKRE